jgi:hypothetical protein
MSLAETGWLIWRVRSVSTWINFPPAWKTRGPAPDFTLPSPPFAERNKFAWSRDRDEQEKV